MKIGLIAMSGVRASSDKLTSIGLTLPGFVERSRVIASLPSLSLLTLAALTPPEIEIEYHEIRDLRHERELPGGFDLVAISSYSAQVRDAYAVADQYRERGVPVVMGGLHASVLPEEALEHAACVVIGEGELSWPRAIDDFMNDRPQRRYAPPPGSSFDLARAPIPRFDLLDPDRYNRLTVQTCRGCPFRCDFCASSILLTPRYKTKPVERVIAEIRAIKRIWPQPFIEFADDNSFVKRRDAKALLRALREEHVRWFTEADVSIAEDADLLDLMRESGCRQVLIGLESPSADGLDRIEMRGNWKLRQVNRYEAAIEAIQSRGITVNGCFILGLDGDTEEVFDAVYSFIERTGLYEAQLTVLTPFPGTPLYARLQREERLLVEGAWNTCTLFDVNFQPRHMSPERLQEGLIELSRSVYDAEFVRSRRQRFFRELRRRGVPHNLPSIEEDA